MSKSPSIFYPDLAIIPSKSMSERCPRKNMRRVGGKPLFLYSVYYALQEGFTPVVSTDSEEIITICKQEGITFFREVVDDTKMENCVNQVLEHFSCDILALLQPTSPFREPGLLRRMRQELCLGNFPSGYTAQKIKLVGHLDGAFQHAYREQDAKRFLYFFDGNIVVIRQKTFLALGTLYHDDSRYYFNLFPCNQQIDTDAEFKTIELLSEYPFYQKFLACSNRKMRICIVSNKRNLQRNYSSFVDSCDKVMRISKMDNLDSKCAGTRTDLVLVSCFSGYLSFSREARHMEVLKQIREIYFNNEEIACSSGFAYNENLQNWKFMPSCVYNSTINFTTLSKGLCLADYLYPDAQLYYLGDTDAALRAPDTSKHPHLKENMYLESLIESGRVIPILEDDATEYHYSLECKVDQEDVSVLDTSQDLEPINKQEAQIIFINHPQWKDQFCITGDRGCRLHRRDPATILKHDSTILLLQWDHWGREEFVKTGEGQYQFVNYQYTDSINEVGKYGTELLINPYDGNNSVFRYFSRPFIGIGYRQWGFLLLLDRMYEDIEQQLKRMPRLKSVLFAGVCKDSLASLHLALRIKEKYPHLHVGVLGCSWTGDVRGVTPVYKGVIISPAHASICEQAPYQSLLARYGDPLTTLEVARGKNIHIHLFSFYCHNYTWEIDKLSAQRLNHYIQKYYSVKAKEDEPFPHVHGKIIQLGKQKPDMVNQWLDEMFQLMAESPPQLRLPAEVFEVSE